MYVRDEIKVSVNWLSRILQDCLTSPPPTFYFVRNFTIYTMFICHIYYIGMGLGQTHLCSKSILSSFMQKCDLVFIPIMPPPLHVCKSEFAGIFYLIPQTILLQRILPVASSGEKSVNQFCMIDTRASKPTSVAHVTSHLTISRRRQFNVDSVMRITYNMAQKDPYLKKNLTDTY